MAHITANRVSEFTQTSGTGAIVLVEAPGQKRFSSVMSVADTCWYLIEWINPLTGEVLAFEFGTATYIALDTLARTEVKESSSGVGVRHSFPAGRKKVSLPILMPDEETLKQWLAILGLPEEFAVADDVLLTSAINVMRNASSQAYLQTLLLENF